MGHLGDELKKLNEPPFPSGLHSRILKGIVLKQVSGLLRALKVFLAFNLLLTGYYVFERVDLDEISSALRALFSGFEISLNFLRGLTGTLYELLPGSALAIFLVNLVTMVCLVYLSAKLSRTSPDFVKGREMV